MQNVITTKASGKAAIKCAIPFGYTQKIQQFRGSKNLTGVDE